MTPRLGANTPVLASHVSLDSPKFHPARVKLGNAKKSLYIDKKNNSLSSFTLSPLPPHARAYVCARVTGGESWETCPHAQSRACATWSRTFANVGQRGVIPPIVPSLYSTQRVATRWPTCDLPVWHTNRYFPPFGYSDWPAGTGPNLRTVSFACPTENHNPIQKGKAMSDSTQSNASPTKDRHHVWHSIVAPTAHAFERFMWRVAWFGLFVWIFASSAEFVGEVWLGKIAERVI